MSDTLPPGVFYRGEHIVVEALLCFGRACHRGTRIGVKDLLDGDAAQVADLYEMDVATVEAVRREARENAARIQRAERQARIWSDGYWYGRRAGKEAS